MGNFRAMLIEVLETPCKKEHETHSVYDRSSMTFRLCLTCNHAIVTTTNLPKVVDKDTIDLWFQWALNRHFKEVMPDAVIAFLKEENLDPDAWRTGLADMT